MTKPIITKLKKTLEMENEISCEISYGGKKSIVNFYAHEDKPKIYFSIKEKEFEERFKNVWSNINFKSDQIIDELDGISKVVYVLETAGFELNRIIY